VLRAVAERMAAAARAGDTVARLSGDELVVICPGLRDASDVRLVADRMRDAVATPVALGDTELVPRISTGIAIARDGEDPEALLRRADEEMHVAKRATTAAAWPDRRLDGAEAGMLPR
jgi:diguanylate cyclase (GGDEF)-like protein